MPKIAIIIFLLAVLILGGVIFYSYSNKAEPEDSQQDEKLQEPQIPVNQGMIQGSLGYPSEGIPSDMFVCAENISSKKKYCSNNQIKDQKYKYGKGYQLLVPAGEYYVFAKTEGIDYYAYYSEFVKCGLLTECDSHKPIKVNVQNEKLTDGIDPIDWYISPTGENNFIETGNLSLSQDKNSWALVYEKPGQPGLKVDLEFTYQSLCDLGQETKNCLILPNNFLQVGDRVTIQGNKKENQVRVNQLKIAQAKDELIQLSWPLPYQVVESPLQIKGKAQGNWFFEGDFPVVLTDWDGLIIAQEPAQAQGEWMTEDLVGFQAELEFEKPELKDNGSLILQKDNPSGLPENADALEIQVFFE